MKTKKSIVISTYDDVWNPFYGGGGAYAIHEVAKRLSKDFSVIVLSSKYPGANDRQVDGVHYRHIGVSIRSPQLSQLLYSLTLPWYVIILKHDVWLENFTPPFTAGFLPLFTNKPVIGLVHMLSAEDMRRKYYLPFQLIEHAGLKLYNYFIVNSTFITDKIKVINPKASLVNIGNGVPSISKQSETSKFALFIGRLEIDQKGLDLLLAAWKKVNGQLVIAGAKGDMNRLKSIIRTYHLEGKIELAGQVTTLEKNRLLRKAGFVVVPSRFETYSMVSLEAFSYGKPVVSFDIDGLQWIPDGARFAVPAYDTNQFADKCNKLFSDSSMRKKMGAVGLSYAKKKTWDVIYNEYKKYITKIINIV